MYCSISCSELWRKSIRATLQDFARQILLCEVFGVPRLRGGLIAGRLKAELQTGGANL